MNPLSHFIPAGIPREIPMPPPPADALPAWIREDDHGGAVLTVGEIASPYASPYASAAAARAELEAMERRGIVRIVRIVRHTEAAPC